MAANGVATTNLLQKNKINNQFLTFEIEDEEYGIPIEFINGIIQMCSITIVPHTESFVKGIFSLRGDIIPVIDVRERFKKVPKEIKADEEDTTCIIDIKFNEYRVGLIVDSVLEVVYIEPHDLSTPPNNKYSYKNDFIKYVGKHTGKLKMIIDIEKLL
ncbi:MAG: chemotaxis protein CheW [Lachnospirales bacterium]